MFILSATCNRAVFHQSTEADEAVKTPNCATNLAEVSLNLSLQVKSLLALERCVRLAADGLQPINTERLKAEAATFGWVAVRAHALEWFDALPARAFERHSFFPMSLKLWPKMGNKSFAVIENPNLYTTSPLIQDWAIQHKYSCLNSNHCRFLTSHEIFQRPCWERR